MASGEGGGRSAVAGGIEPGEPRETRTPAHAPLPPAEDLEALVEAIGPFAVVDLETTGLDPTRASVVEVAAVALRPGAPPEVIHSLVDPRVPLPLLTKRLTGLRDADLFAAPSWDAASRRLAGRISGLAVVAHNAAFERAFLGGLLPPATRFLDTLELACVLRPELAGHSLQALASELLGRAERHRALDDAIDTLAVLACLQAGLHAGEHAGLRSALARGVAWDWAPFVERTAPRPRPRAGPAARPSGQPGAGAGGADDAAGARRASSAARTPLARLDERALDADLVRAILADEDRWRAHFPAYRVRSGQIDLACAIVEAFRSERSFAAEAGTGIGKTLAYGLVSLLHVRENGGRVVVSSANRTLQERLVREELPRIAAVLGIEPVPALVLKGRANYASPARVRAIAGDPEGHGFPLSPAARLYLTSFLDRCRDGDLQGFGGWLAAQEPALWSLRDRLGCSGDCNEARCRAEPEGPCPYLRRVDALHGAGIVSVNHSLLLTWPSRYGPIDRLVVDEAHELAAEADRTFAEELRARDLRARLRQLGDGDVTGGLAASLGARSGRDDLARRTVEAARRAGAAVEEAGRALAPVSPAGEVAIPIADHIEPGAPWDAAAEALRSVARACGELAAALDELLADQPGGARADDPLVAEAGSLSVWLLGGAQGMLGDVLDQSRPDTVYAARGLRRADHHDWWVRATPLETGPLVHARLLEPARTVIAVSATLGIGGDPEPSLKKLGWYRLEQARRMETLLVPSPFDFERRCVLALVRGESYRDRGFVARCARAIADVASLLQGRTLALFTSRQRLGDVVARLGARLPPEGIAVLAHERAGGAARLVEQFAADPRAVLAGTRSLWQGVDVPGEALSCVVIDKLPFPPPDDPLARGRAQRLREAGGDPFRDLSLEPAVIGFKQMFGRLIRAEDDRGFVVVLGADPEKPYVDEFVRSLPGPPRVLVGSWEEVLAAMRAFFARDADDGSDLPGG